MPAPIVGIEVDAGMKLDGTSTPLGPDIVETLLCICGSIESVSMVWLVPVLGPGPGLLGKDVVRFSA